MRLSAGREQTGWHLLGFLKAVDLRPGDKEEV